MLMISFLLKFFAMVGGGYLTMTAICVYKNWRSEK